MLVRPVWMMLRRKRARGFASGCHLRAGERRGSGLRAVVLVENLDDQVVIVALGQPGDPGHADE